MNRFLKNTLISLSDSYYLSKAARKWGRFLGVNQFVAGTDVDSVIREVKLLNEKGISCTVDHLGEFVTNPTECLIAKEKIMTVLKKINFYNLNCHLSVKLTQLGLDIDETFCLSNMKDIVKKANKYNIFVNIDTEDYAHYEQTLFILHELKKTYNNVGTVIQSYLYRAEKDMNQLTDTRLRIVKGAYKESPAVAYQLKEQIDENFIYLTKKRLLNNSFTSIATHDHRIINEIKTFVKQNDINKSNFEFQMLYGFRTDLQEQLVNEGYRFCTYIPFGEDWYGYFMRRLAERPQNVQLIIKEKLYTKENKLKKGPLLLSLAIIGTTFLLYRKKQTLNKK